ncbi:hypothetical protein V9T40_003062 [Parthenolecanium corni]|uniref:Uncharacterized protein n=1 Tax=Parthenolecanium corni TaxID=536013 RepID=A0AAN9Y7N6_9HEMI
MKIKNRFRSFDFRCFRSRAETREYEKARLSSALCSFFAGHHRAARTTAPNAHCSNLGRIVNQYSVNDSKSK